MKKIVYISLFVFVSSCFHQQIYSCSAPRQTDIFIEIKNNKFFFRYSGAKKSEELKVLINNKMEIVAEKHYKYIDSKWKYSLNKIEKKLNITQRNKGRLKSTWNFKCTKI